METIRIALKDLVQNTGQIPGLPANPRQWTKKEIDKIAKSLQETPELFEARPIIVIPWEGKYIILGGNLRYEGCKRNKDKDAPCFIIPDNTPVDKMKEIVIKDNGSFGSWDTDVLANKWDDCPLADWGVPDWVTDVQEEEQAPVETKEDDFDENTDEIHVRCKPGDIWQLGDHRLMCGDSTNAEDVSTLMDGQVADMVFQSPPYNAGDSEKLSGNTHFEESKYKNYDDNNANYLDLLVDSTENALDNSKYTFVNLQPLAGNKVELVEFLGQMKDNLCDILIWRKTTAPPVMARRVCNSAFEFVFVFSKTNNSRAIGTRDFRGNVSNVFDCSPQRNNEFASVHAATFSVELVGHYIETFTNNGEGVADLFGGTGTTLVACEQLGRKCYMMELDPLYCDVIIARWEKLTGKEAVKIEPNANKLT